MSAPAKPKTCEFCKSAHHLALSEGPGRVVGPIARNILGIEVPLPDDFRFWWCTACNHRCIDDAMVQAFWDIEQAGLVKIREDIAKLPKDE